MTARLARDDEVATWRRDGWVLLEGLVGTEEIDAATVDLREVFPAPDAYHADPEGETERWLGRPRAPREIFTWPATGPGFRPEQHRWRSEFPFSGSGALNRLCVHDSVVDFVERALQTDDLRCYQAQVNAKYTGLTNYEQPMHTDRNHSWLPVRDESWWHVEAFLYLSDVDDGTAPTHLVSVPDAGERPITAPLIMPDADPELYGAARPAVGRRGSLLAYRSDVFHRAVDLTEPGGARFLLNVSFKVAGHDWIGFHSWQSRATSEHWTRFVEHSSPRELALFGFPPPGHPIWDDALLEATAIRYPKLDLGPWRDER
ncbi:MAG: hypothetical protein QOI55_1023 [Actinomycetota bacterium]|nr:hypothetical protein [Actinomycetota bacterium]